MKQIIKIKKRRVIVEKVTKPHEMWFKSILNNLTHKAIDKEKYPDYIFFFKNEECFFEYNQKNGNFWCSHDKIWSIFETEYNMNYQQIQASIKGSVEEHFKLRGLTPFFSSYFFSKRWKNISN